MQVDQVDGLKQAAHGQGYNNVRKDRILKGQDDAEAVESVENPSWYSSPPDPYDSR